MSLQGAHQINNIIQHMFTQDNFLFYRGNLDTLKFNMFIKLSIRWETCGKLQTQKTDKRHYVYNQCNVS